MSPLTKPPTPSPFRVLHHRNYRLLWTGSVAAALGGSVGGLIVNWIVFAATHNPLAITALGIASFLPTLIFGVYAGALVDRWDRRRLIVGCNAGRAICYGVLAISVLLLGVDLAVVLACVFAVAALATLSRPASNALLPRILSPSDMTDGNGLLQAGSTAAGFLGSPLGGVLLVALAVLGGTLVGAAVGLGVNAATETLAGVLIALMFLQSKTEKTKPSGPRPDRRA